MLLLVASWPSLIEPLSDLILLLAASCPSLIEPRAYLRRLFLVAMLASVYLHGLGADAGPCGFDMQPNDIDTHHERLWDTGHGEIARCTRHELSGFQATIDRLAS